MPIKLKARYGERKIGDVVSLSDVEEKNLLLSGFGEFVEAKTFANLIEHTDSSEESSSEDPVDYNLQLPIENQNVRIHNSDRTIEEVEEYIEAVNDAEELKSILAEEKESKKPRKGAIEIIEARLKEVNEDES